MPPRARTTSAHRVLQGLEVGDVGAESDCAAAKLSCPRGRGVGVDVEQRGDSASARQRSRGREPDPVGAAGHGHGLAAEVEPATHRRASSRLARPPGDSLLEAERSAAVDVDRRTSPLPSSRGIRALALIGSSRVIVIATRPERGTHTSRRGTLDRLHDGGRDLSRFHLGGEPRIRQSAGELGVDDAG